MAQLPYYGLNQGNLQMQSTQEVVDEYAGLREEINIAQKYAEQKEAIEANKILSQARSELSINMNKLQQETGLDAEGFTEKVNEKLTDYENKIMESVPYSQRDNFTSNFAGIKYGLIEKAGAFEVTAATEKMKNDVNESVEYNSNAILSDFTQRQGISEETAEMIDSMNLPESAKNELKKTANQKYAVSEINALVNINPSALLSNLNNGVYDKDITSEIKAAAINQAKSKIKSNEAESKLIAKQNFDNTYNQDMSDVMNGKYNEVELVNDVLPKYKGMPKEYNALRNQFETMQKDGDLLLQTAQDMQDGMLIVSDDKGKVKVNSLYGRLYKDAIDRIKENKMSLGVKSDVSSSESFQIGNSLSNDFISKTGYMPKMFSNTLISKWNSGNLEDMADASKAFYIAKKNIPNLQTSLSNDYEEKMMTVGIAMESGYSAKDIISLVKTTPDKATNEVRKEKLKSMIKKGDIKSSLDFNDATIKSKFSEIFNNTYMQIGDEDIARKVGENYVNTNYGKNSIGSGSAGFFETDDGFVRLGVENVRLRSVTMFQPPIKMYSNPTLSESENVEWMTNDLFYNVREFIPDAKYSNIVIENNNRFSSDGRSVYDVYYNNARLIGKNGSLLYWKPDYEGYIRRKAGK